jgi:transmembrane sensor
MNQPRLAKVLREEASHWWVRLDSGEPSDADREAFEAWRAQSADHRAAFAEICALWGELDALKPRFVPNRVAAWTRKPARARWTVAASLLLALIVIPMLATRPQYRSSIGEIRIIKLEDGSTVYLSSGSALDTDFGPDRRHLELLEGEACSRSRTILPGRSWCGRETARPPLSEPSTMSRTWTERCR